MKSVPSWRNRMIPPSQFHSLFTLILSPKQRNPVSSVTYPPGSPIPEMIPRFHVTTLPVTIVTRWRYHQRRHKAPAVILYDDTLTRRRKVVLSTQGLTVRDVPREPIYLPSVLMRWPIIPICPGSPQNGTSLDTTITRHKTLYSISRSPLWWTEHVVVLLQVLTTHFDFVKRWIPPFSIRRWFKGLDSTKRLGLGQTKFSLV